MDAASFTSLAAAWAGEVLTVARLHPVVAFVAVLTALVAFVLSRSVTVFVVAAFLAVAAVLGSEPVDDPLKRAVFVVGAIASVLLVSLVVMRLRLERLELRAALRRIEENRAVPRSADANGKPHPSER